LSGVKSAQYIYIYIGRGVRRVGQWQQFRWGGWIQARSSKQRNKVGKCERGEREGDPGYLAVSDSEVEGYTGKKEPVGWWSTLVGAE
jgi:hypothetical protein